MLLTDRLLKIMLCIRVGYTPDALDALEEADAPLVDDMLWAVRFLEEREDQRFEVMTKLIAGARL